MWIGIVFVTDCFFLFLFLFCFVCVCVFFCVCVSFCFCFISVEITCDEVLESKSSSLLAYAPVYF